MRIRPEIPLVRYARIVLGGKLQKPSSAGLQVNHVRGDEVWLRGVFHKPFAVGRGFSRVVDRHMNGFPAGLDVNRRHGWRSGKLPDWRDTGIESDTVQSGANPAHPVSKHRVLVADRRFFLSAIEIGSLRQEDTPRKPPHW